MYTTGFVMKNHLTTTYPYVRTENSYTGCTSVFRRFCNMLWYWSILFILNQSGQLWIKDKITVFFTVLNVFLKALNFYFWQVSQSFDFYFVQQTLKHFCQEKYLPLIQKIFLFVVQECKSVSHFVLIGKFIK